MWILDFVLGYDIIPETLEKFSSKYIINPLAVYMYKTNDEERRKKLLQTLQQLITRPHAVTPAMRSLAESLITETKDLYVLEKPNNSASGLLQSLINLVVEVRDKYDIHLNDQWFLDISEVYSMIVGLGNRSDELLPSLFEQFKSNHGITNEITRESAHPYSKKLQTKEIYCKGADQINVKFDTECKGDVSDSILFTYDKARLQEVQQSEGLTPSGGNWNSSKGVSGEMNFSNGDKTITRSEPSNYEYVNAFWSATLSKCKVKITFTFGKCPNGYISVGIIAATDSPNTTNRLYEHSNMDLWMWNSHGSMVTKGNCTSKGAAGKYTTGNEISLMIDLFEKTMTCFKGTEEIHKFENIAENVLPAVCFGCEGGIQITVKSVEKYGGDLSGKQMIIKGDRVFYHFPVNSGYLMRNSNRWAKDTADWVTIGNGDTRIRRKGDKEGPTTHYSQNSIANGRHYYQVRFARFTEEHKVQVGFAPGDVAKEEYLMHDNSAALQSNGLAFINCAEKNTQKFSADDVIGCYLDKDAQSVAFYINGTEVLTTNFNVDQTMEYFLVCTLDSPGQEVHINTNVTPPEKIDLIGVNSSVAGSSKEWGYKFKASPVYNGMNQLNAVANLNERQQEKWNKYKRRHMKEFTQDVDQSIVAFIDEHCLSKQLDPMTLDLETLKPQPEELIHYEKLEKLHISDLKDRLKFLVYFNKQIDKVLHLLSLDLSQKSAEGVMSIKKALSKVRFAIFYGLKNSKFNDIITSTTSESAPNIKFHRARAILLKNKGRVDVNGTLSVFGQMYQNLKNSPNTAFRSKTRIFYADFVAEGSQDAGGPYNEVISMFCEELQSKYLQLFVPCQNNVHNIGENRDTWIINPAAETAIQKQLFIFLGKMMGVAIRTQNNLNFSFPPIFWKKLVMEDPTEADLKGMDSSCFQMLEILRNLEGQKIGEEEFKEMFADEMFFTTTDSGGRIVELIPDGKNIQLTYDTAYDYAERISKARLNECTEQYALLRKGLSAVIPLQLLSLFTWQQVETKVCGTQDVSIDILMEKTRYNGIDKNARYVEWFWEVLREITPKERSLFLRFVWGRSRLPQGKDFDRFTLTALSGAHQDEHLPVSHTCFFQLDLPAYSSKKIMRDKLLYAITHCRAIDIDHVTQEAFDDAD